jgi:hypothetical protein
MSTAKNDDNRLIRVQGPALPVVKLSSESEPTAPVSELIRVHGPALPVVTLMAEPATPVTSVNLRLPLGASNGERMLEKMHSLIARVNEIESILDRPGVWVDGARSGVQDGNVVMVLVPHDQTNAVETCKRLADQLFAAVRTFAGVTIKVMSAENPEKPVYELAM